MALEEQENRINVARAAVNHIHLGGKEPCPARPAWLHVYSRAGPLSPTSLAEQLARWGTVDVQPLSSCSALVAAGNHRAAREILEHFRGDRELAVTRYSLPITSLLKPLQVQRGGSQPRGQGRPLGGGFCSPSPSPWPSSPPTSPPGAETWPCAFPVSGPGPFTSSLPRDKTGQSFCNFAFSLFVPGFVYWFIHPLCSLFLQIGTL